MTYSPLLITNVAQEFDKIAEMEFSVVTAIEHAMSENWPTWPGAVESHDTVDTDKLALIVCSVLHLHPQTYLGIVRGHVRDLGR